MKILVMGDCHLKPWMFYRAEAVMKETGAERLVFLGDLADDWNKQFVLEAYENTLETAIDFAKQHPETIFILGNHDVSYLWQRRETGYSPIAAGLVARKLERLREVLPQENPPVFVRRLGRCIFSHGGVSEAFIYDLLEKNNLPVSGFDDTDQLIGIINEMGADELWQDVSPLWYRPQYYKGRMYKTEDGFMQVTGHTPVEKITLERNVLSCDVFSTERDGRTPIGTNEYVLLDTVTLEWKGIQ